MKANLGKIGRTAGLTTSANKKRSLFAVSVYWGCWELGHEHSIDYCNIVPIDHLLYITMQPMNDYTNNTHMAEYNLWRNSQFTMELFIRDKAILKLPSQ